MAVSESGNSYLEVDRMPVFEYRCMSCSRKFSKLVGVVAGSTDVTCSYCGSNNVLKLISKFIQSKNQNSALDAFENAALAGDLDNPKGMSKLMKEMGKEICEDTTDDFDECLEEAEKELYDEASSSDI